MAPHEIHDYAITFLSQHCYKCHNEKVSEGKFGYALDVSRMIEQGYIVPGNPLQSPLYKSMNKTLGLKMPMPPRGASKEELDLIYDWITKLKFD